MIELAHIKRPARKRPMNANTDTSAMRRNSAPEPWVSRVCPTACPAMMSRIVPKAQMATKRTSPHPASPGYRSASNGIGIVSVRLEVLEQELAVDQHEREHEQPYEDCDGSDQVSRERAAALHCGVLMEGCCSSPTGG